MQIIGSGISPTAPIPIESHISGTSYQHCPVTHLPTAHESFPWNPWSVPRHGYKRRNISFQLNHDTITENLDSKDSRYYCFVLLLSYSFSLSFSLFFFFSKNLFNKVMKWQKKTSNNSELSSIGFFYQRNNEKI